jgi:hypothetical protein
MVMIAFIDVNGSLVPLFEGPCGNCWQEWAGFLTPRGGLSCVKAVGEHDTGTVMVDVDASDDESEVLADQRNLEGTWSRKCINRAVLVGTSIKPDSNASILDKRPRYWTAKEGVYYCYLFNKCL